MSDMKITNEYQKDSDVTLFHGDVLDFIKQIPDQEAMLIITSPPYNVGKEYEKKIPLEKYIELQSKVIAECVRILNNKGSICWEVGNFVDNGEIFPLDIILYNEFKKHGLKMRNRIVWHFEHGLHGSKRFSGRHESIMWFTKSDNYNFNLDTIRIPQKYPGKLHYKGKKKGQLSGNPLGKNPGDVWIMPNVKHNHVEKTIHPCQFPVGLIDRLVKSMTNENDLVFDPFIGVGTTAVAAVLNKRRVAGADIIKKYLDVAHNRVIAANKGVLKFRSADKPIYSPTGNLSITKNPFINKKSKNLVTYA